MDACPDGSQTINDATGVAGHNRKASGKWKFLAGIEGRERGDNTLTIR
jgi:hypothetical protein